MLISLGFIRGRKHRIEGMIVFRNMISIVLMIHKSEWKVTRDIIHFNTICKIK